MSYVALVRQSSVPPTPPSGKTRCYINSGGTLASVDDAGVVTTYSAGLTQEQVEDYVGNLLQDSTSVDVTYNDAGNVVTFTVLAGGVNHNALLNYVANQHIDHSSVSIIAGAGLTGGGDLTASRTISLPNTGTAGTYRSVTTDAQGRVTAGTNPTTLSGYGITDAQPLDGDLTAVANLVATGFITRTAANTMAVRTMTAGSTQLSISNGDGISGNPTFDVVPGNINHNLLLNGGGTTHVDHATVSISAGTGLTGGGDLTATRTLSLANTAVTAGTYGSATQVPQITVDAQGRLTGSTNVAIAIPSTAVTDFAEAVDDRVAALLVAGSGISLTYNDPANTLTIASTITQYTDEQAQDTVAAMIQNGTGISWSYNDAGNTLTPTVSLASFSTTNLAEGTNLYYTDTRARAAISATDTATIDFTYTPLTGVLTGSVLPGGVDHNSLLNWVANKHIDHSAVSIVAGTYMSGGGDLTASRTLNHAASGATAGSYGGVNAIPVFSIGATGHVESVSKVNPTSALLTGLTAVLGGASIAATDTILQAFGKMLGIDNNWTELCTASTHTNTSAVTGVNVTELALPVVTGRRYYYEATLLFQTAATTTGIGVTITSPDGASAPGALLVQMPITTDGTAAGYAGTINTLGDYVTSTGVQTANTPFVVHMKGNFPCNASGTFNITFRSEVALSQVTVLPGSTLLVREFP